MQYYTLDQTDLKISRIAFGCWAIVGGFNWGEQDERDSLAALRAAYDAGITFFDTAKGYGDGYSEQLIARALGDVRSQIIIASKVSRSHLRPDDVRAACERSLKNLNTDFIDLYQIHWPNPDVPLEDTMAALLRLKNEGKIRHIGVSNFAPASLRRALACGEVVSNQVAYNLLFRAAEFEIIPFCREHSIPILCYSPLMQGLLTGKFSCADEVPPDRARTRHFSSTRPQTRHGEPGAEKETFATVAQIRQVAERLEVPMAHLALAWLLAQPSVAAVIVGGRNAEQARFNARSADLALSPDALAQLTRITEPLKTTLGPNPDMWQSASRVM